MCQSPSFLKKTLDDISCLHHQKSFLVLYFPLVLLHFFPFSLLHFSNKAIHKYFVFTMIVTFMQSAKTFSIFLYQFC